ncbi:hypothetical protein D3C87_2184890 [compost metagenome]
MIVADRRIGDELPVVVEICVGVLILRENELAQPDIATITCIVLDGALQAANPAHARL